MANRNFFMADFFYPDECSPEFESINYLVESDCSFKVTEVYGK
jgi:hypothetical protein